MGAKPGAGGLMPLWLVMLVLLLVAAPALAAPQAQASLDPSVIAPGDSATLTITIANEDAHPVLPQVPGLRIMLMGQSVSSQYYGGGNSQTVFSRTYQVSAGREGDFTIAPISVNGVQLKPLRLKVSASAAAAAGGPGASAAADEKRALPFLRVVVPRTRLYVGQEVPIQIKAYFREGTEAHMEGPLAVTGDAFTATGLDAHPSRSQETLDGQNWVVLTWSSVLGAIKSGDYPLNVELPLLVRLRLGGDTSMEQRLQQMFGIAHTNGFIGDDLDQIFGRQVERHLVLRPPATQLQVLPLPSAGRPADFSGAVGHFDVTAGVAPASGAVGDPLTLKITVAGKGNLSRINTAGLQDSAQWRTYRPEVQQAQASGPGGVAGVAGSKTFSQPIVPRTAGSLTVPGIALSWFDPDAERYETRETPALTVRVSPAREQPASGVQAGQGTVSRPAAAVAARPAVAFHHARSLRPLILEPWFMGVLATPVAGLLLTLLWQGIGGRLGRVRQGRQRAGVQDGQRWVTLMDAAITRGDAVEFFEVVRRALQERPGVAPEAVREILEAADRVAYGRGSMSAGQLRQWREQVAGLLARTGT